MQESMIYENKTESFLLQHKSLIIFFIADNQGFMLRQQQSFLSPFLQFYCQFYRTMIRTQDIRMDMCTFQPTLE